MALELTINPLSSTKSLPEARQVTAPNIINDNFLSFGSLIDVINPLQQLPVVGDIYRAMTGDTISSGARILGGTLFGGPVGFLLALANEVVQSATGSDISGNMLTAMTTPAKHASAQYQKAAELG